ncbi:serine hydrolase [Flavobacteriaceae bacterium R38]|nr:serine hydrolase [Flavobacteriaceae bacterium R38]
MKKYLIVALSIIVLSCNKKTSNSQKTENLKVLEYLKSEMEKQKIPASQIAIIQNGEVVISETIGLANVPFSVKANDSTVFSINSIGKIFTSTAIMQLAEQGKLKLSDKVYKHLTDLPESWNSVTIKNLLSQTSGLPSIEDPVTEELLGNRGLEKAWELAKELPIQFEPYERFDYNATNFLLLYKLIEKCSGMPYKEFVTKNQFDVAEMEKIYFQSSYDVLENKSPTYSYYHQNKTTGASEEKENLIELNEYFPKELTTDSGAYTTATEMTKWILALLDGKFLKDKESIATMWEPVKLKDGTYDGLGDNLNAYALGWPIIKSETSRTIVPFGGGRACIYIHPKENTSIILFTNLMFGYPNRIVDKISELYLNDKMK